MNNLVNSDIDFFTDCINSLTEEKKYILPSEYAEQNRYLTEATTSKPGPFSFSHTPYLREIIDCFAPGSPVRQVALMKAAHIGGTVGVIENLITYHIGMKPVPVLFVTSDEELAEKRITNNIEPAIESCNLKDKIFSQSGNKRRTGDKVLIKEFVGGMLHAIGSRSPSKTRSMSYRLALIDEIDSYPPALKKDGDVINLIENRVFKAFKDGRAFYISTPLTLQTSQINKLFLMGDQRYYNVPCKYCGEYQVLKWHIKPEDTKTGDQSGIIFDVTESGRLIPDSVHYRCPFCGGKMYEHDKVIILPDGKWIPTEEPTRPEFRSYHINSLYAPVGVYTWIEMAYKFLNAWDVKNNRVKDFEKYRDFRQTDEGLPFEERGEGVKFERVIRHRRMYKKNDIPNDLAEKEAGSKILFLLCGVDVQGDRLYVDIKGIAQNGVNYTIDFRALNGDPCDINSQCWQELDFTIMDERWRDKAGNEYKINCTFVDANWGKSTDTVERFCNRYSSGVYPIFGRSWSGDKQIFRQIKAQKAMLEFELNTDKIKDRLFNALRQERSDRELLPDYTPNFPEDLDDDYFKFFESEYLADIKNKITGQVIGRRYVPVYEGIPNHGLDTFVYLLAALEFVITTTCEVDLNIPFTWHEFWRYAKTGIFYRSAKND